MELSHENKKRDTIVELVLDDELTELKRTEKLLSGYEGQHPELEFVIQRFESAGELLGQAREENYMPPLSIEKIYNTIFKVNWPSSKEKEQSAPYFLQKAIIERVPIPCSFSFDSGIPSFEKTISSLQGFVSSNISLGL